VTHLRARAGLASEPLDHGRVGVEGARQDLHGDAPHEVAVQRLVDDAHPAAADDALEHVRPERTRQARLRRRGLHAVDGLGGLEQPQELLVFVAERLAVVRGVGGPTERLVALVVLQGGDDPALTVGGAHGGGVPRPRADGPPRHF
jgi:hypothetical protein